MIAPEQIPEPLRKHCAPGTPAAIRMLAARGAAPLPPKDLIVVQCVLAQGEDATIAAAADASLRKYPDNLLLPVVQAELPPFALAVLGNVVSDKPALLEPLLLNRGLTDDALAAIVPRLPETALPLVFGNEQRLLRSVPLVHALRAHPAATASQIDRMVDFLVRAGVIIDGIAEFASALMRLSPQEALEAMKNVPLPEDLLADPEGSVEPDPIAEAMPDLAAAEVMPELDATLVAAPAPPDETKVNEKKLPLLARLQAMTIAQKVAVALKGNREVRSQLLRDPNKLVAVAAVKNSRMTESEAVNTAQSRNVHEEVVRLISMNGEWTRNYGVKLALVGNPKTPLPVAMKYLPLLKGNDVKNVAKSKNIPSAVVNQAKILLQKQQH